MIPLSFLYFIILKILTFSYIFLSVGRPSRKTSAIRAYQEEEKIPMKRFYLQDTIKTSIKTMGISTLLNMTLVIKMTQAWFKRMIVFPRIILFTSSQNLHAALVKKLKDKFTDKNKQQTMTVI